jgi:uncharacterized membrane protein
MSLAWSVYQRVHEYSQADKMRLALLTWLCGAVLGALIVTNTWDFPIYFLLVVLGLFGLPPSTQQAVPEEKQKRAVREKTACKRAAAPAVSQHVTATGRTFSSAGVLLLLGVNLLIMALLVASPFLSSLHSEARRPQPLMQPASPPRAWLLMWGVFTLAWLWGLCAYAVLPEVQRRAASYKTIVLLLAVPLVAWLALWLLQGRNYFVLILIVSLLAWTALATWRSNDLHPSFLGRMALCGLLALLWSETTWSGFLGTPEHIGFDDFKRQDTVFKFGLQTWYLWGTAAVCGVLRSSWAGDVTDVAMQRFLHTRWLFLLFVPITLAASSATTKARARDYKKRPGWDAWAHLRPSERNAARWLQNRARAEDTLIEAEMKAGGDYSEYSRYAHATGIPTVIGPQAHTFQWGVPWADVFARKEAVRTFYTTRYAAQRNEMLQRYEVRYIVCGALERQEYGVENLMRIEDLYPPVFQSGEGAGRVVICLAVQPQ